MANVDRGFHKLSRYWAEAYAKNLLPRCCGHYKENQTGLKVFLCELYPRTRLGFLTETDHQDTQHIQTATDPLP